jgi:hypothetical protein
MRGLTPSTDPVQRPPTRPGKERWKRKKLPKPGNRSKTGNLCLLFGIAPQFYLEAMALAKIGHPFSTSRPMIR